MNPSTKALITTLEQLEEILAEHNETHWRDWIATSRREIHASDHHGVERLLRAYGGMGSFNDLMLPSPAFDLLRSRAYALACEIKRAAERRC